LRQAEEIWQENKEEFENTSHYATIKEFKGNYYVQVEQYDEAIKCYEEVGARIFRVQLIGLDKSC
jgi:tetratricopeptide (TPR) repeat protein